MLLSLMFLSISLSIDSLGIGITYGLKNTKISFIPKCILFCISLLIAYISIKIGNILNYFLPDNIAKAYGSILLCLMGIWIIYQSFKKSALKSAINNQKKIYNFFIKSMGITIKIIRNPISSDLDNSKTIDWKEAIYLAIAISMDCIGCGIAISTMGLNSLLFPVLVSIFQLVFLSFGNFIGKKLNRIKKIPDNICSIFSGILLIIIGLFKFLIT